MMPIPPQQGQAFCRAGHPVLDLPQLSFHDLLPYRFAGAHFPVAVLERVVELFEPRDSHVIELAIQSDNMAIGDADNTVAHPAISSLRKAIDKVSQKI